MTSAVSSWLLFLFFFSSLRFFVFALLLSFLLLLLFFFFQWNCKSRDTKVCFFCPNARFLHAFFHNITFLKVEWCIKCCFSGENRAKNHSTRTVSWGLITWYLSTLIKGITCTKCKFWFIWQHFGKYPSAKGKDDEDAQWSLERIDIVQQATEKVTMEELIFVWIVIQHFLSYWILPELVTAKHPKLNLSLVC